MAIRVAAGKLRKLLEGGGASSSVLGSSHPGGQGQSPADSRPALPGQSWAKGSGSSVGLSKVQAADPAAGAFLGRCAKALAQAVGPIAKVYVEEAVRRVSPDAPFALASAAPLVEDLASQIEDRADRKQFRAALAKGHE